MAVEQVAQHSGARTWKWLKIDRVRGGDTASGSPGGDVGVAECFCSPNLCFLGQKCIEATTPGEERTIVIPSGECVQVAVASRSVVHIVRLQTKITCRAELEITVGEDARVSFAEIILPNIDSSGTIYSDFTVRLAGARSSFRSDVAYMAADRWLSDFDAPRATSSDKIVSKPQRGCTVDVCHTVHHDGRATRSVMRIAGSVAETGDKVYRGTIDFHKGCCGSKGEETEEVLMLSPTAKNRSLPVILCDEEDVEGEHGATIGRLDEATLFYVNSRGVSSSDAIGMICRAKLERVAHLFQDEGEKAKALQAIDEWFTRG